MVHRRGPNADPGSEPRELDCPSTSGLGRRDILRPVNEPAKTVRMTDQLFQPVEQRLGPGSANETTFEFLERGARKEAVAIRHWMQDWFAAYPEDHREELRRRLQLKSFREFMAAHFELQVFAMLCRLGCRVEIHPKFTDTRGTVDFRAGHGNDTFYVEATVSGILREGVLWGTANEQDAVDKIRAAFTGAHSHVHLATEGQLRKTLSKQRLLKPIRHLLESTSAEEVQSPRLYGRRPQVTISEGEWEMRVSLSPPAAEHGRCHVRGPARGGAVDGAMPLQKALGKKAEDWKNKGLEQESFIVAINACHSDYSWGAESRAIYGRHDAEADACAEFPKPLDRVAGVIVFGNATLGKECSAPVKLYENRDRRVPECLQFLRQERRLRELLGTD